MIFLDYIEKHKVNILNKPIIIGHFIKKYILLKYITKI